MIYQFTIELSRIVRISSVLFIISFLIYYNGYSQRIIFIAIIFILLRDILLLDYETPINKTATFLLSIAAYCSMTLITIKKLKILKATPVIIVFVISLIALNAFNLYYLSDVLKESLDNNFQYFLFFVQGAVLIVFVFLGFMYNERYEGKTTLIYLYSVLCFILSDLCGLAAYYYGAEIAYYPERGFYILALILITNYALNIKHQKGKLFNSNEKEYLI